MGVDYDEYIQSAEWRQRANEAKRCAGYRCRVCNRSSKEVVLDAHHRTYKRLGHEDPDDITVLCRDCHELFEMNKKVRRPSRQQYQPATYQTISTTQSYKAASEKIVLSPEPVSNVGSSEASLKTMALTFIWVLLAISLITILLVYFSPIQEPIKDPGRTPAPTTAYSTLSQDTKFYSGPGVGYAVLGTLERGASVIVSGYVICESDTWYQIEKDRWIVGSFVGSIPRVPYLDSDCRSFPAQRLTTATSIPMPFKRTMPTAASEESTSAAIATVNQNVEFRNGPGTGRPILGTLIQGRTVIISGYAICDQIVWYHVAKHGWVMGEFVDSASINVPYHDIDCLDSPQGAAIKIPKRETYVAPVQLIPTKRPLTPTSEPILSAADCAGGCTEYPDWCAPPIKGNVSYDTGERIYHVPGQEYYNETKINPAYGERWFCTEQEARAAGWRRSKK